MRSAHIVGARAGQAAALAAAALALVGSAALAAPRLAYDLPPLALPSTEQAVASLAGAEPAPSAGAMPSTLLIASVAAPAAAQVGPAPPPGYGGGPLSLAQAVQRAVDWNPALEQAAAEIAASDTEVRVARAAYYPAISGGIGTEYDNRLRNNGWAPRPQLSVSQMLHDFGKVRSDVAAARAGVAVSRARMLLAVDSLVRDTAQAVIEIQRHEALLAVADAQLESIRAIDALVQQRSGRGASTRSDAVQAAARVEQARAQTFEIRAQLGRWQSTLAYLLGRPGRIAVRDDAPQWLASACDAGDPDWPQVPQYLEAEAERSEASARLARSRADMLPTLSLAAGAAPDVTDPLGGRSYYNVGLSVKSSLFQGGASQARRAGAEQSLRAASAAAEFSRLEVSRSLAEARQQVASLRERRDVLDGREGMMRETGKLYRLQYLEMGTRTLIDLLNAEQELHQARFDRVNAEHDLRRLGIECTFSKGRSRAAFQLDGLRVRGVTL